MYFSQLAVAKSDEIQDNVAYIYKKRTDMKSPQTILPWESQTRYVLCP